MKKREPLPSQVTTALVLLLVGFVAVGAWALGLRRENAELRARLGGSGVGDVEGGSSTEEAVEEPAGAESEPVDPSPAPAPAEEPSGERTLSASQRELMLTSLRNITADADRRVWFATASGDREADAYRRQLQAVFEEAGWRTERSDRVRFPIRPGIYFLMADTEPPDYVLDVLAAIDQVSPTELNSGRGYREFFDERTREDPSFNGFAMTDDQKFVIVIGRNGT